MGVEVVTVLPQLVWGLPLEETNCTETIFLLFYTWVELSAGQVFYPQFYSETGLTY